MRGLSARVIVNSKANIVVIVLACVLAPILIISVITAPFMWLYKWRYDDHIRMEQLITYQFQDLNREINVGQLEELPHEVREVIYTDINTWLEKYPRLTEFVGHQEAFDIQYKYHFTLGRSWIYYFTVNGEIYTLYEVTLASQNFKQVSYIYKLDTQLQTMFEHHSCSSIDAGFFIKDNHLYFYNGSGYRRINVLTVHIDDVSKTQFETEYFKIIPPYANLAENGDFRTDPHFPVLNFAKRSPDNLIGSISWFVQDGGYYFIDYNDLLCKYDIKTQTYIIIARLGRQSISYVLHDGHIYYIYGQTRWRLTGIPLGDPHSKSQKGMNFACISLATSTNEIITEQDYMNVRSKYV